MPAAAIVLAAGSGVRLGKDVPKAFVNLAGRPILRWAAQAAAECPRVADLVVVVPGGREDEARSIVADLRPRFSVVAGGSTRQASVRAALQALPQGAEYVLCHDAARPFANPGLFSSVLAALEEADGVVPVVSVSDTVKRVRDGIVVGTEPRAGLMLAQTPQAFRVGALRDSHRRAEDAGVEFTDDAGTVEWAGYRVRAVPGDPANLKITSAEDLRRAAERASGARTGDQRVGLGFDVHPRGRERTLLLAGVRFEGEEGLAGHSDADVVCHALADALLGAAGMGDIGDHFPEADASVAGIAGLDLLRRTVRIVLERGLDPSSADVTVICGRPAVAPRREEMRRNLAGVLGVDDARISVKATRPEGLGLTGDGAACLAIATLSPS